MKKFYYLIITLTILISSIIYSEKTEAATSIKTTTSTLPQGQTITCQYSTLTSEFADEVSQDSQSNTMEQVWNFSENVTLKNLPKNKYINGRIGLICQCSPTNSATLRSVEISSTKVAEGLNVYLDYQTTNYIRLFINFDNYYTTDTSIGLPSIEMKFHTSNTNMVSISTNINFTFQYVDGVTYTDTPTSNGFAGTVYYMLMNAIEGSSALADIFADLETIRTQDLSYYNQITASLSSLLTGQTAIYNKLLQFITDVNTDFQQVQTVLDLFPSYRTAVLQYWQELLNMNAEQSSAAAANESEYQDKDNQSTTLLSGMNELNMPDLGTQTFNILENTDETQRGNWFYMLSLITHTSIVTKILLIIVTAAIVGFVLYGKN